MFITGLLTFITAQYYAKYSRLIDAKLEAGPFSDTANIYAAPPLIETGERISTGAVIEHLHSAGYTSSPKNRRGWYRRAGNRLDIFRGPHSYFGQGHAAMGFAKGKVAWIIEGSRPEAQILLEPPLIANISEQHREKRRLVRFSGIPRKLVDAVISAEDKRFFEHDGFDSRRLLKAAWVDLRHGRKEQGASTITMQLARSFWLVPDKRWSRKAAEMLMTLHLEHKLSKQEIFEDYANEVYLGHSGTFSIHGFGEAARVYFGKDIGSLTLPEAAALAGLIQRPGYFDPFRYPERTLARRNVVLARMRDNGYITRREFEAAAQAPLTVAPREIRPGQAPYFVDLVNNRIRSRFQPGAVQDVYTTLDLDLQRAASAAVEDGMARLDARLKKQRGAATPLPEVALVAIDPQTGAVKALIGGRNYASSQLDRALAERQPGSAFKPFVYAAAFNTGLAGGPNVLTPASIVDDEPTTFVFGDQTYAPENFKGVVYGPVTLRTALEKSINVATVMVAQQTGYGRVAALARAAGLTNTRPTPALALGSYDATPLALAGAYTVFANAGTYVEPELIAAARTSGGDAVYRAAPRQRPVLDPRVAWLVGNLMQGVIQEGTGAGVRAGGFTAPAAGKTGTSKDGWFAGFTSKLLCVVWVGFDDGHDLDVEGARSALPIWTGFMKRALSLRRYADPQPFAPPDGIATAQIDPDSGQLATIFCPSVRTEYFLEGTAPQTYCTLHQPRWTVTLPPALPAGGPAGPPAVAVPTVR